MRIKRISPTKKINRTTMAYQNLFNALQDVCGFIALESDMFEIITAYEKDKALEYKPKLRSEKK